MSASIEPSRFADLIQQQRRRWRTQESDEAVARRAERAYFRAAMILAAGAVVEACVALIAHRPVFLFVAGSFVVSAALLKRHSQRFTEALRSFTSEKQ